MNARAVAEETISWYQSKLDPYSSHAQNVRRFLQGAVMSLTQGILTGKDELQASQYDLSARLEEKKVDAVEELDKSLWGMPPDSKAMDDLYHALERRHRARLDAFMTGVEIAMPSEETKPTGEQAKPKSKPAQTPVRKRSISSPTSSMGSLPETEPLPTTEGLFTPLPKKTPARKGIESSPVLSSMLRSVSVGSFSGMMQPQMEDKELRIRLELYLRSLHRVKSLGRDCVIAAEPDRAIKARADMIVSAFVSTVGCVRSMSPSLTKLLVNLTKELLSVEFVGEDLYRVIRRIVNEHDHGTSFASLAFLSSPDSSAETRLAPLVLKYIRYLQSDWKTHERACELERMLSNSLDGQLRRYLKTVEFQSIGHLLEVCQGFRNELNNIELTPSNCIETNNGVDLCNNPEAVRQAIRDLQREVITINGHALPPVTSRKDLINLLSQALNSKSLTATPLKKKMSGELHDDDDDEDDHDSPSLISTEISTQPSTDTDGESSLLDSPGRAQKRKSRRATAFHLATVDLLTRRLLIAASRTGTGGDAYFIVRDLFGDEDVEVVPAKVLPHHVRATRVGSIEIQVRLASVTIKCHGSFDIYPKSLVGCCEPLIQLHTTTSETIYLRELRPCDSDDGERQFEDDGSRSSDGLDKKLVLEEKQTSKTGTRMLSIRPALYEKVQVWNTPS